MIPNVCNDRGANNPRLRAYQHPTRAAFAAFSRGSFMKRTIIALLATTALAAVCVPAAAANDGWYVGLGAGWTKFARINVAATSPLGSAVYPLESDDSALVVGTIGYRWNHFRLENEFGWSHHDLHVGGLADSGGHSEPKTYFMNATYDYPLTPKWSLTFGGGIGVGIVSVAADYAGARYLANNEAHFGAQGIVGLTYAVSDNIDIGVDWRYRQFFGKDQFTCSPGCLASYEDTHDQAVMFNLRFFMSPPPPPPPPPAPPPPPPPPPPAPPPPPPVKTFIVFFDFNKSNLTEAAQSVVSEAVKTAKSNGFVRVKVTGHTDTVGSDQYNQELSEQRAQSVKDEMVREGLDGSAIGVEGRGFHDPLVPTGPGVREPQNRRAVIDLGQ
jgi:opacity protein-like surface antigen